jgi:adhesin/invasin
VSASQQLTNIVKIAGGGVTTNSHALALSEDGTAWGWGMGSNGQLGRGNTTTANNTAERVMRQANVIFPDIIDIAASSINSYIVTADRTGFAMGRNDYGQIGNGVVAEANVTFPSQIQKTAGEMFTNIRTIIANENQAIIITTEEVAFGLGNNENGRLGNGNTTNQSRPAPVQNQTGTGAIENVTTASTGIGFSTFVVNHEDIYTVRIKR